VRNGHVHDLIPAFALHALDAEESAVVERHAEECSECARELRAMFELTAELAAAVPEVDAPRGLRSQIFDAMREEPRGPPLRPALVLSRPWAIGLTVTALILVVALGALAVSLNNRLGALQARLAAQEEVLALLAAPTAKTTTLRGTVEANVRFVYDLARGRGALVVTDLRDPGSQFVYQLWLVSRQGAESVGVFRPAAGRPIVLPVRADFTRYQAVAVSVERAPRGAAQPTQQPILVGTI
jgi:anti-sigma-K factor RskA